MTALSGAKSPATGKLCSGSGYPEQRKGTKIILIFLFIKKTNAPGRTARARSDRLQAPTILERKESFQQGLETHRVFNACWILGEGIAANRTGGEQLFGGKKSLRNASIPTGPRGPLPRIGFAAGSKRERDRRSRPRRGLQPWSSSSRHTAHSSRHPTNNRKPTCSGTGAVGRAAASVGFAVVSLTPTANVDKTRVLYSSGRTPNYTALKAAASVRRRVQNWGFV